MTELKLGQEFRGVSAEAGIARVMQKNGHRFECFDPDFPEDGWNTKNNWDFMSSELVYRLALSHPLPDSGDRTEFNTGAVRDAMSGKGLPSLIPPEALRRLARRFEDGSLKYGKNNWQKGIPLSRYHDAILRHTLAAAEGKTDEDHLGAVLWNAAAWVWTEDAISSGKLPEDLDDRTYTESSNAGHS